MLESLYVISILYPIFQVGLILSSPPYPFKWENLMLKSKESRNFNAIFGVSDPENPYFDTSFHFSDQVDFVSRSPFSYDISIQESEKG